MGISYPTVKKNIEDLCISLNMKEDNDSNNDLREETKRRLKRGEISFEDAERILGKL